MDNELTIIIEPCEEGGFVGYVPEVPGAVSQGETPDETREMLLDALQEVMAFRREEAMKNLPEGSVVSRVNRAS